MDQKVMFAGTETLNVNAIGYRPTPQVAYDEFCKGASMVVGGSAPSSNYMFYDGADDLIAAAAHETDNAEQQQLWTKINDQILRDAVVKPLYVAYNSYGARKGFTFGGVQPPKALPGTWQPSWLAQVKH